MRQSTLLLLGDSLVDYGNWQNLLPRYTTISLGVPGERSEELLRRLPYCCSHEPVDAVLVMTGINNLLAGDPGFTATVKTIITRLKQCYSTASILICSLAPAQIPQFQKIVRRANSDLRTVAETSGALYLDLYSRFEKGSQPLFASDGVHFNNAGYALWADLLSETLGTLLAKDRD